MFSFPHLVLLIFFMILACDGFCQSMSSEPQTLLLNLEKMVVEEMIKFLVSFFNWSPKLLFGYGWIQIYPLSCCTSIDVILKYGWLFLVSWVWSLIFLTCLLTYFFFFIKYAFRFYPTLPGRQLFTESGHVLLNGPSLDESHASNFLDLDWLSSSGNSCEDEFCERSSIINSTPGTTSMDNVVVTDTVS